MDFMKLLYFSNQSVNVEKSPIEIVERKGIGHPDTLADILAEVFSSNYSKYCLEKFGAIANHYVDKVTLIGAKAEVDFGKGKIIKPIIACLFGKTTRKIGKEEINIEKIFKESVLEVFSKVFNTNKEIVNHIEYLVRVHDGKGLDHPGGFYTPVNEKDLKSSNSILRCNDTVMCTGYFPYSPTEKLCINIENYLNSKKFKKSYPETGFDIKVLCVRVNRKVDTTICIPFIAKLTPNRNIYNQKLKEIKKLLKKEMISLFPSLKINLHINTKDEGGKYAYLTVFGSALDKRDQGAVGRGNRYNGLITINREMNTEAYAGKNPLHHGGKLYNVIAHDISHKLFKLLKVRNIINITARNGDLINNPAFIIVKTDMDISQKNRFIEKIVIDTINNVDFITRNIIFSNPLQEHIKRSLKS